jgi:hypothetical protein
MANPQPGTCSEGGGQGHLYGYADLEGLWINAGGDRSLAYIAAAIAMAESGGCTTAKNSLPCAPGSYAQGLWQICMPLNAAFVPGGNAYDPAANAKAAVAIYQNQGWGAWTTYGGCPGSAYCQFISKKTTPNTDVPGSTNPTGGKQGTCSSACLACFGIPEIGVSVLHVGGSQICLMTKTQARAFIGTGILLAGSLVMFVGLALLTIGAFRRSPPGKAAEKAVNSVSKTATEIGVPGGGALGAGSAAPEAAAAPEIGELGAAAVLA